MEPEVEFEAVNVTAAEYDLVVIGSGPAGQKGAIAAAKARKRVAVIDRTDMMGGVSVHTGTIPSKTLREAIFQLTGLTVKALYGNGYRSRGDISVQDLSSRVHAIIGRETEVVRESKRRRYSLLVARDPLTAQASPLTTIALSIQTTLPTWLVCRKRSSWLAPVS